VLDLRKRNKRIKNGFAVLSMPLQILKLVLLSAVIAVAGFIFADYRGLPYAILILLVVVALSNLITMRTSFGRHVYAIGGNVEAARLSGINVQKTLLKVFLIMGAMCGVAAIVYTSRLNAATTAAGVNFELDAIAACFIGGTAVTGGYGTAIGAIIGALVMASLDNGMSLMNGPIMWQYLVKGGILLLAVWVDTASRNKK
jgi:D-xylose transport system permease protein